jgi:hypothetical protein
MMANPSDSKWKTLEADCFRARSKISFNQLLKGGDIEARDIPGQGCIFSIRLPKLSPIGVHSESPSNGGA